MEANLVGNMGKISTLRPNTASHDNCVVHQLMAMVRSVETQSVDDQGNIVDVQNEIVLENGVYQFAYSNESLTLQEQECCNFVVIDSVMRRDYQGGSKLYYLSEEDGVYSAHSGSANESVGITFTVKNGILSAKIASSGRVYQLKKNDKYAYSQESKKLDTPSSLKGEIAEGGKDVYFSSGAGYCNVSIGLRV